MVSLMPRLLQAEPHEYPSTAYLVCQLRSTTPCVVRRQAAKRLLRDWRLGFSTFLPRTSPLFVAGYWTLDTECWMLHTGRQTLDTRCWILDTGHWMLVAGCWILDAGYQMLDARCQMLDAGCQMLDAGCRKLDTGHMLDNMLNAMSENADDFITIEYPSESP